MNIDDISDSEGFTSSFLFIGPQGVGKTVAACSFPDPILYDNERKLESLKHWYNLPEFKGQKDKIRIEPINDIFKFANDTTYDIMERGLPDGRQTAILDSITNSSRDIVNAIIHARQNISGTRKGEKFGGDRAKVLPGNVIVPSWDEFDAEDTVLGIILGNLFTAQRRHGINIVVIAHPHKVSGPNGVQQVSRIVAKGHKAPQTVLNFFNEIYHFEREFSLNMGEAPRRIAITQGGEFSRTAWPFLPAAIDFSNRSFYDVLMEHLKGGQTNEVTNIGIANSLPQSL